MAKEKKITKAYLKKLAKRDSNKRYKEWGNSVKDRDGRACVICKETKLLNAHHIIPREIPEFRWDVDNGVSLCPKHHKFNFKFSAHRNPLAFLLWFLYNRTAQHDRLVEKWLNYYNNIEGLKNVNTEIV
ncbi:MAG: HNH endonuclease [Candidatus Omnitrophica bacterium]|jgi:hypothetical protein|nr:HNH endonuclease [Candidatus Omnitrophota bacterium]